MREEPKTALKLADTSARRTVPVKADHYLFPRLNSSPRIPSRSMREKEWIINRSADAGTTVEDFGFYSHFHLLTLQELGVPNQHKWPSCSLIYILRVK